MIVLFHLIIAVTVCILSWHEVMTHEITVVTIPARDDGHTCPPSDLLKESLQLIRASVISSIANLYECGDGLWEILTFGELPLVDLKTNEIVNLAESHSLVHPRCNIIIAIIIHTYNVRLNGLSMIGHSLLLIFYWPTRCPDEIFDAMCRCHKHDQNDRITDSERVFKGRHSKTHG